MPPKEMIKIKIFVRSVRKIKKGLILKNFVQNASRKISQPKTENLNLVNVVKTVEFPVSFTKLKPLTLGKE